MHEYVRAHTQIYFFAILFQILNAKQHTYTMGRQTTACEDTVKIHLYYYF
jgi:hypothetical protein